MLVVVKNSVCLSSLAGPGGSVGGHSSDPGGYIDRGCTGMFNRHP